MAIGDRLKQIRLALGYTQERMAEFINSHSGKGSRASVSNWETGRSVEAEVVRAYGELAESLGLVAKGAGAQWVIDGEEARRPAPSDEKALAEMASIELFLRSQRELSQRSKHQIRDFYRRVLEGEKRARIARELKNRPGGAEPA